MKFSSLRNNLLGLGAIVLLCSTAQAITILPIDYPGSNLTFANGIYDGLAIGTYYDAVGLDHGFTFDGSNYVAIDHPLADAGGSRQTPIA